MRGPLNVSAMANEDGSIHITAGKRNQPLAMSVTLEVDQAYMLYQLLGGALGDFTSEKEYQDWLARNAGLDVQVDQGGEVIPLHTMEDDLA